MSRKKKLIVIYSVIAFFIIAAVMFVFSLPGENLHIPITGSVVLLDHPPRLSDVIPYIQDGDIILRMTEGTWSMTFREFSPKDKRFSHCGIVRKRDSEITIIQSMGSFSNPDMGVEQVSLNNFLTVASSVGIFRLKGADGSVISDTAMLYLDRLFDFDFDLEDDSKVYCTELLYLSLKPLNYEHILPKVYIDEIGKPAITMDSISNNSAFEELVYIIDKNGITIDEENQAVLRRDNPVKVKLIQRLIIRFGKNKK